MNARRLVIPLGALAALLALSALRPGRGRADAPPGRYCVTAASGDQVATVLDGATGLTWHQAPAQGSYTWADAKAYCAALPDNGKTWRLPSMKEGVTLGDESSSTGSIDATAFPEGPTDRYWTLTSLAGDDKNAWAVAGMGGNPDVKTAYHRVRCVVAGP